MVKPASRVTDRSGPGSAGIPPPLPSRGRSITLTRRLMYNNEKRESVSIARGIMLGLAIAIPLWIGAFALTTWLVS